MQQLFLKIPISFFEPIWSCYAFFFFPLHSGYFVLSNKWSLFQGIYDFYNMK